MFPVYEGINTIKDAIELLWHPIIINEHTGGVPILKYHIEYDQGGYSWTPLTVVDASLADPIVYLATELANNRTYKFKIRGENIYGKGSWSEISYIRPTGVPEGITPVETGLVGTNVYLEWQSFLSNGREVTAYEVVFQKSDGVYAEIPLFCNGRAFNMPSKRSCMIPMLIFRLSPFYRL